ncbi:hypothetical protein EYF80_058436 [Liparis tanakae]|uniref:Uncharacterized protein n=1 Tax=Liparis tanakae TaxID=230148 RepID=A0A4Z2ESZ8_9TELE|nr:hypothetical protein EYF80_058436 [Liparis tanakae]
MLLNARRMNHRHEFTRDDKMGFLLSFLFTKTIPFSSADIIGSADCLASFHLEETGGAAPLEEEGASREQLEEERFAPL